MSGLSISLRRDRSHEPRARHRSIGIDSMVGRIFRTCVASHDSFSVHEPDIRGAGKYACDFQMSTGRSLMIVKYTSAERGARI
jgi:hypothetical protein